VGAFVGWVVYWGGDVKGSGKACVKSLADLVGLIVWRGVDVYQFFFRRLLSLFNS
jgi:hypothetical protein